MHEINITVKELGHTDSMLYYYIESNGDLNHGLRLLQMDVDINESWKWLKKFKLMEV